ERRGGNSLIPPCPHVRHPPTPRTSPTEPSPVPVWPLSVLECSVEGVHLLRFE
ncbi:hypothetical protein GIV95_11665, partial [Pseudomonas syringae]|nr:hypothetical protein [Pseudomonas syringae]